MPTFSGEAVLLFYVLCSVLGAAAVFALFKPWRFAEYAKPVFLTVFSMVYFLASFAGPALSREKFQGVSDNVVHGFTASVLILPAILYYAWSRRDTDHQTTWPRLEKVLSIIGGICLLVAAFFFILTMIVGQIEKVETLTIAPLPKVLLTLVGIMLLAPIFLGLASMFVPKEAFHQLFTGGKIKGSYVIGYLVVCIILLGLVVVTSFL